MRGFRFGGLRLFPLAVIFMGGLSAGSRSMARPAEETAVKAAARKQVDALTTAHFGGDNYLREFDRRLDELVAAHAGPGAALVEPSYFRLVAAWTYAERERQKIGSVYRRPPDDDAGHALRDEIAERLRGPDRVALQGLAAELSGAIDGAAFGSAREAAEFAQEHAAELDVRRQAAATDLSLTLEVEPVAALLAATSRRPAGAAALDHPEINGASFPAGRWALTFDDGPSAAYTPTILDNLDRHGLKASFMWLAQNAPRLTAIVRRAGQDGMALCNHSFTHPNLAKMGAAGLAHEIGGSSEALAAVYGQRPRVFRCPYGSCGVGGSTVHQLIRANGLVSALWNVDSLDWQDHNPQSVYQRVKKQMALERHGIILFHDIHPQSVVASELVMRDLSASDRAGATRTLTLHQALDESAAGGIR